MRWELWVMLAVGCGRSGFDRIDDAATTQDSSTASDDGLASAANRVFVTSTRFVASSITSLTQADAACADRAAVAGLPGQYVAWFTLGATNPRDRLAGARGWVRPDGAPVADLLADLLTDGPIFPLLVDESGTDTGTVTPRPLTGTADDGTAHSETCATTGMIRGGRSWRTYSAWTSHATQACDIEGPLYCFGIDRNIELVVTPSSGRRAFVSTSQFAPASGRPAADDLCAADAAAASLPGTFRALLPTATTSAASRFDANGPTWVRMDGVALAPTADAFLRGELQTSLDVRASGTHVTVLVATGGTVPTNVASTTCGDWTMSSGSQDVGDANAAGSPAFNARNDSCGLTLAVYCLEE